VLEVSLFYLLFEPHPPTLQPDAAKQRLERARDLSLDECVAQMLAANGQPGARFPCSGPFFSSQMRYFCGFAHECRQNSSAAALDRATSNVREHFAVVGVLGELELSLGVFEHVLPGFFRGLQHFYAATTNKARHKNKRQSGAPPLRPETLAFVRAFMDRTGETAFYAFCLARFHAQVLVFLVFFCRLLVCYFFSNAACLHLVAITGPVFAGRVSGMHSRRLRLFICILPLEYCS
jgi:hypothetical protein